MASSGTVRLPSSRPGPLKALGLRFGAAVSILAFVALVAFLGRDGYEDGAGGGVSFLDAVYYATVSVTTTGYGDITPVTDTARLLTVLLITPARVLFLIILVGTTIEVLAESSRVAFRERLWRRTLRDHVIVCGYGTKGRSAIEVLLGHGSEPGSIVVIDQSAARIAEANEAGFAGLHGDAARASVLIAAGVRECASVIVAPDRDDTAVLITLTVREENPKAQVIAAVREDENRHLLHQSGADSVITSSGAAGRLLGFAARSPQVVEVLEDLLSVGTGLDIVERQPEPELIGRPLSEVPASAPVIAVARADDLMRFDDPRIGALQAGDRLVCLCSN